MTLLLTVKMILFKYRAKRQVEILLYLISMQ